ncbi:MAG: septum formation initiator family protein [Cryomorphaceae bacterium]|jgi:cell division protein FtsB|nr:septum formation initiator family protein [Cryomorphaceae bacterium]
MRRIPNFLRSKYVLAGLLFAVWMLFLDSNNLFIQWELSQEVRALEDGVEYYRKELTQTQRRLNELESDPKQLEKFARETYWMHRPGEEVMLVEPLDPESGDTL